jgi:hypothetical protein
MSRSPQGPCQLPSIAPAPASPKPPTYVALAPASPQRWLPVVSTHCPGRTFETPARELRVWFEAMRTWFREALCDRWREERMAQQNLSPAAFALWQQAMSKHERRQEFARPAREQETDKTFRIARVLKTALRRIEDPALVAIAERRLTVGGLCWAHQHFGGRLVHEIHEGELTGPALIVSAGLVVVMVGRRSVEISVDQHKRRSLEIAVDQHMRAQRVQATTRVRLGGRMVTIGATVDGRLFTQPCGAELAALRAFGALAGKPDRWAEIRAAWAADVRSLMAIAEPKLSCPEPLRRAARIRAWFARSAVARGRKHPEESRGPKGAERLREQLRAKRYRLCCSVIGALLGRAEPRVEVAPGQPNSFGVLPGGLPWVSRSESKFWEKGHRFPRVEIQTTARVTPDWYETVYLRGRSRVEHEGHSWVVLGCFRSADGKAMVAAARPGPGKKVNVERFELDQLLLKEEP